MSSKLFSKILSGVLVFIFLNVFVIDVSAIAKYDSVDEFVSKSYEVFLNRDASDDVGVEYWSYLIKNHEESLYDYLILLVSGEEFSKREITNEDFVNMIYKLFVGEDVNDDSKNYWVKKLNDKTTSGGDVKSSRIEIFKEMIGEPLFKEFANDLGITYKFQSLNEFGVDALKNSYSEDKIEYVDNFYKSFSKIGEDLYKNSTKIQSKDEFLKYITNVFPIFDEKNSDNEYEQLKNVASDNVERLVYEIDYKIVLPHEKEKSVYISPFLQMNEDEKLNFVTLGLGITSRGLGKEITKAEIILGDELIPLDLIYKDQSKYDSKGIAVHEFEFKAKSVADLELLDKILSSTLSKIRFTFDDGSVYLYSLYEKDRLRNTLRFMSSLYTQIIASYLLESKDMFDSVIINNLI